MAAYEASGKSDDWITPAYIFRALGEWFDLDVAAAPEGPRYVPTWAWYSADALARPWHGLVWMNPPFGHQSTKREWLRRFFDHGNGIALVPDRTSAPWFQEFAPRADLLLMVAPKIKFERIDGTVGESPGTGTVLMAAGSRAAAALRRAAALGMLVTPSSPPRPSGAPE
jgi:hypothetical protein